MVDKTFTWNILGGAPKDIPGMTFALEPTDDGSTKILVTLILCSLQPLNVNEAEETRSVLAMFRKLSNVELRKLIIDALNLEMSQLHQGKKRRAVQVTSKKRPDPSRLKLSPMRINDFYVRELDDTPITTLQKLIEELSAFTPRDLAESFRDQLATIFGETPDRVTH